MKPLISEYDMIPLTKKTPAGLSSFAVPTVAGFLAWIGEVQ